MASRVLAVRAEETRAPCEADARAVAITVGTSRRRGITPGECIDIRIPPGDQLLKSEPSVVAWAGRLEDGTQAFFKLYTRRPRRRISHGARTYVRACREFNALSILAAACVPCTQPLFWGYGHTRELGRVEIIVTTLIEGAETLRRTLQASRAVADEVDWKQLLSAIDAMHRAGIHHGGLSPKNILIDAHLDLHICDLAKSMQYPFSVADTRLAFFDRVHLFNALGLLIGRERSRAILAEGYGDPELADRITSRTASHHRRQRVRRKIRRAEFHLRNLWAWYGWPAWRRVLGLAGPEPGT